MTIYNQYKLAEEFVESIGNMSDVNFHAGTSNPDFHFKRAKHLLKLAGNPDRGQKIIHVGGTSGKGSTVNYIYNILQNAGHKVGAHFSPFVSVSTEKIQINGKYISMKEFVELVEEIKPIVKKCHETYGTPSYFEVWMLMTLLYFKKNKVDYTILEVGCGGRYDGTNAVAKTLVSVITNVGLDHTHILGNTIGEIAYEKAGIIRRDGKVFTTAKGKALKIIEAEAKKLGADCKVAIYRDSTTDSNEALARAVSEHLSIDEKHIQRGIEAPRPLPARMEVAQKKPLVVLDGAHNPDKLKYLAQMVEKIHEFSLQNKKSPGKLHLICALGQHKDPKKCFKEFVKHTDYLYATRSTNSFRKFIDPVRIVKALAPGLPSSLKLRRTGKARVKTGTYLDPQEALKDALKNAKPNDLILITGSFFLCSDLRRNWISEEDQLKKRTSWPK